MPLLFTLNRIAFRVGTKSYPVQCDHSSNPTVPGLTSDTGLSYYCICLRTGTKITQKQEQVNETTETDSGEVEEAQPSADEEEQHAGFIGDVLNVDAPEGSLDVGFI